MSDNSYATDEFGRPDGRDHHYRIPLNDERAVTLASRALKGMWPYSDRFVVEWDGFAGDSLRFMGIRTNDSKGHLDGLADCSHSPRWESCGPMTEVDEYRDYHGGTKVRGSFRASPEPHMEITLSFDGVVDMNKSDFEAALENRGDDWNDVQRQLSWLKDERLEEYRQEREEQRQSCDHTALLEPTVTTHRDAKHVCETCGAETDADGERVL